MRQLSRQTAHGFEVHELHGGHSDVTFDYRIMARRKGFEKVRMQDVTAEFAQMRRESETLAQKLQANKVKEKLMPALSHPRVLPQPIVRISEDRKK